LQLSPNPIRGLDFIRITIKGKPSKEDGRKEKQATERGKGRCARRVEKEKKKREREMERSLSRRS